MNKIIPSLLIAISLFALSACKKDKKLPLVTTSSCYAGITNAQVAGVVYDEGSSKVTEKGICWGEQPNVSIGNNKVINPDQQTTFTSEITGLEDEKTYYARAYAKNEQGVSYGKEISFRTQSSTLPLLSLSIPPLTTPGATSALVRIDLSQQVRSTFTVGVCWSTNFMPTISDDTLAIEKINQNNPVPFSYIYNPLIKNLNESTTYYVRAFSTNGINTTYSNQISVTTKYVVSVFALNSLGFTSASVTSSITGVSASSITAVGVCWSTNPLPTTADSKAEQGYSGINYTSSLNPLNAGTTYYVRSYVKTASVTYYSPQKVIITYKSTVTDIDGNSYNTVQIGNKEWMTSNLKTTRYNNGATIQHVANYNQWVNSVNAQTPVYCYYADNAGYNTTYGKLYPQYVAFASNIAPVGWHVATLSEWQTLLATYSAADLWNGGASFNGNYTGLSLVAGGLWDSGYAGMSQYGYYWAPPSLSQNNTIRINASSGVAVPYYNGDGLSIRCVKN